MKECPCCDHGLLITNSLDMEALICPKCHWSAMAWFYKEKRYAKADKVERKQILHEEGNYQKLEPWSDNPGLLPAISS